MAQYHKKPVIVEAVQWNGGAHPLVETEHGNAYVLGKQGYVMIYPNDWIIAEQDGSGHYPCNPEVFTATYEAA
jgi:hypothetical protein